MPVRIAINGFGRIGRYLARISLAERQDVELVAINSRGDTETLAHLLRYDSIHGPFKGTVEAKADSMIIDGKEVHITRIDDPHQLPWKDMGVQIVLESTGAFRDRISNEGHLASGAHKVIIGAPGKKVDATFVYGVNHETYAPQQHQIVSNASCTTNCLAPVAKVIHDNFGLEYGLMTTIHSYTMDQRLLDGSHKDLRRARAAALSMVPTTTGAARVVTEVITELKGRLDGLAVRVPTANVSVVDLVATVKKSTTKEEVNRALATAQAGALKGVLHVSTVPLVSIDYNGCSYSSIVDAELTNVMGGNLVKVMAWYDNESGFSHRMIDMAVYMGQRLGS
ncbi:MAG: type I glyceraldehyde-3-phosphate dehydrogenase [Deltaproteobacteria bacterium]|nr:type I glyceraldehyde-3-phosphate dehydrogenase [Deltaproteobacteria bacterium]MBW1952721.1 type I glyceraldehyde-3-phosphate dehydrogenase [Deltaproteobacteria bacterium]MBW1986354.1 type I glyceraldehyde-3-phosphate dehydrogenase [Deltaproteobacteria bacterium]MBW2133747.1 type I glyceraldehyde-3-phosphate dehydrogenase [Deltaproteobacteria bacterium]